MIYFSNFDVPTSSPLVGALVYYSSTNATSPYRFTSEVYDTNSFHDNVSNTERLTVPSGVSLVRVYGNEVRTGAASPLVTINRGAGSVRGLADNVGQENNINAVTAPLAVSAGDFFTQTKGTGGTEDLNGGIWFGIEVLDASTKFALVGKTSTQALTAATPTMVTWDTETTDTDGFHDNVTNNSRLTVPSGVSRVRLCCNLASTTSVNTQYIVQIKKNGSNAPGLPTTDSQFTGRINLGSAIMEVSAGDYFEVECTTDSGQTINTGNNVWFSIEEVPNYARVLVKKTTTQSVTSGVAAAVVFGASSTVYDANNCHDESTNNTRLTVPSGYTKARLSFNLLTANAAGIQKATIMRNGGSTQEAGLPSYDINTAGAEHLTGYGAWVDVVAGDYFELIFTAGANQTLPADDRTWFAMELR